MEADRRHTTTGVEDLKSCFQSRLDLAQLIVDGDAQALKGSGRDMDVARPGLTGNRGFDGSRQIARRVQRAPRHDELGDSAGPPLLPVSAEDALDLGFVVLVDDLRGCYRAGRIHAHVERTVGAEAEPALRLVELCAGDPEVEQDQVRARETVRGGKLTEVAEATLDDRGGGPEGGERLASGLDRFGIAIDPEQPASRCDPVEKQAGVARPPQGAVDRDLPLPGLEQLYYFF